MTESAASLLQRSLVSGSLDATSRSVLRFALFQRLISRDENCAWTSGQWMTERIGGSDVWLLMRLTHLTVAELMDHHWVHIVSTASSGSLMSILLAMTADGRLSAFYAPMRRTVPGFPEQSELNGITIHCLKNKLGTKALPTAELQLNDTRAYLLGTSAKGSRRYLQCSISQECTTQSPQWGFGVVDLP